MKILVFLRSILDPNGFTVNRRAQHIFINREEYVTNPADRCALEAALQVAGGTGPGANLAEGGQTLPTTAVMNPAASEIVTVSVGPARVETALREALALGAGRAYRIDQDDLDEAALARALARLIKHLDGIDLVLLGNMALDTGGDQAGPRLAEELGWRYIGDAWSVRAESKLVLAVQELRGRWFEVEAQLPAVIAIPAGAYKPRLPSGARLINEFRAKDNVCVLSTAELGLSNVEVQPAVKVNGRVFPPEREPGHRLEGSHQEMAAVLAIILQKAKLT